MHMSSGNAHLLQESKQPSVTQNSADSSQVSTSTLDHQSSVQVMGTHSSGAPGTFNTNNHAPASSFWGTPMPVLPSWRQARPPGNWAAWMPSTHIPTRLKGHQSFFSHLDPCRKWGYILGPQLLHGSTFSHIWGSKGPAVICQKSFVKGSFLQKEQELSFNPSLFDKFTINDFRMLNILNEHLEESNKPCGR